MHGTTFGVETTTREFVITTVLLGGMRFQRDFRDFNIPKPAGFQETLSISEDDPRTLLVTEHLTDEHSYSMTIRVPDNCTLQLSGKTVTIRSQTQDPVKFTASAWTCVTPLTQLKTALVEAEIRGPTLRFLAFHEGVHAGSINYRKPFGRDSLISSMMGMLTPRLRKDLNMTSRCLDVCSKTTVWPILSTIDNDGRVIHEPIQSPDYAKYLFGDFNTHYDRKMIDTDFLVASAIRNYMDLLPGARQCVPRRESRRRRHASPSASSLYLHFVVDRRFAVRRTSERNSGAAGVHGFDPAYSRINDR